jgi:hypothetical protein
MGSLLDSLERAYRALGFEYRAAEGDRASRHICIRCIYIPGPPRERLLSQGALTLREEESHGGGGCRVWQCSDVTESWAVCRPTFRDFRALRVFCGLQIYAFLSDICVLLHTREQTGSAFTADSASGNNACRVVSAFR